MRDMKTRNLDAVKREVRAARYAALHEAKRTGGRGYYPSRGTFLATLSVQGQCPPAPMAECKLWKGTLKEINSLITLCLALYPDATEVVIGGGFDFAESVRHYADGDYTPWISSWEVSVWKR